MRTPDISTQPPSPLTFSSVGLTPDTQVALACPTLQQRHEAGHSTASNIAICHAGLIDATTTTRAALLRHNIIAGVMNLITVGIVHCQKPARGIVRGPGEDSKATKVSHHNPSFSSSVWISGDIRDSPLHRKPNQTFDYGFWRPRCLSSSQSSAGHGSIEKQHGDARCRSIEGRLLRCNDLVVNDH